MICNCPSQIYDYALLFSPPSSWLRKYHVVELPYTPRMVKGPASGWQTYSRTVPSCDGLSALSHWNNAIAVGCGNGKILILDATTGSQIAVLSGHTNIVQSMAFSSDGRSLVSGSDDKTVKLWDMQTGGVVKTFYGHTGDVWSVSISADCTRIASGGQEIYLWDVQTGEPLWTTKEEWVYYIIFSPIDPQCIISVSFGKKIKKWDVNGHQIPPTYDGTHIAFSPDHSQFALCNEDVVIVQSSDSREILVKLHIANGSGKHCCFSPDGKLIAVGAGMTIYVWDITSPGPHPIGTCVTWYPDLPLVFSSHSSLISTSGHNSITFWKIGTLLVDPVTADQLSTPFTSPRVLSVSLQARAGIAVSSDENGVVRTWDISTGLCKASFQIPDLKGIKFRGGDAKLINGRLIFALCEDDKIHIWDTGKEEFIKTLDAPLCKGVRISEDGSRIFCLCYRRIQAWPMWTWEPVCEVQVGLCRKYSYLDPLCIDNPKFWIHTPGSPSEGWDFGTLGSSPVSFDPSTGRPHLDIISGPQNKHQYSIKDTITGQEVFLLRGKYANPYDVRWDGQYLIVSYESGEVLILDFGCVLSRDM